MADEKGGVRALLWKLGPGLVAGAADDDPGSIGTFSQAGAQFGFGLLWTMTLTYPLMSAVQLICAHIGRVTGKGLASNMAKVLPGWAITLLVVALFVTNTINAGADLNAMGDAAQLVVGGGAHWFTVGFALLSLGLQMVVPYKSYANILKWLTVVLFAYILLLVMVKIDWSGVALGMVWPRIEGASGVTTIVAIFGATISPFLFFWQSSQEVEEIDGDDQRQPLKQAPSQAKSAFGRIRLDTLVGMGVSNLVALAIIIGTASTLHATGKTDIESAADAAKALEPVAGKFASLVFSLGIIGTGLLAIPVLTGSVAYALADSRGWTASLEKRPAEAKGFYAVIAASTLLGVGMIWSPFNPVKALFWSAVINGVVAVPIMVVMMLVVSSKSAMGDFTASPTMRIFGWAATAVMAAAACAMAIV